MAQSEDWRVAAAAEYAERRNALMKERNETARLILQAQADLAVLDEEIGELDTSAKVFGLTLPDNAVQPPKTVGVMTFRDTPPAQFKDLALDLLRDASPAPLKAKEIHQAVEARTGRTYHWKTAGMTLYRLSQDGLVKRVGHKWFYVPQPTDIDAAQREETARRELFDVDP
jgi:hypothetical protein